MRNRRFYATLLSVRKRRATTLALELTHARLAHQRCLDDQSQSEKAVGRRRLALDQYAARLANRTRAGRAVVLQELQAGREHRVALEARLRTAEADLQKAVDAVAEAALVCDGVISRLKSNDAHMESLSSHLLDCQKALARAKEESEEEESADLGLRGAAVSS